MTKKAQFTIILATMLCTAVFAQTNRSQNHRTQSNATPSYGTLSDETLSKAMQIKIMQINAMQKIGPLSTEHKPQQAAKSE